MSRPGRPPRPVVLLAVALVAGGAALLFVVLRPGPAPSTLQGRVRAVAETLRCPVCQDLSVADSPSPTARDMRAEIATDLRRGMSPDAVRAVFVGRYGDWILLSPPRNGITLAVWIVPAALFVAGLIIAAFVVRRWTVAAPSGQHIPNGRSSSPTAPRLELSPGDRGLLEQAMAAMDEERD